MGYENRLRLIKKVQELRKSKVFCFVTSTRPEIVGAVSSDCARIFFDHLVKMRETKGGQQKKIDLLLCSNGGSSVAAWKLVSLIREFTKSFNVLIPSRVAGEATLIALGADEIIMHPFGELGSILLAFPPDRDSMGSAQRDGVRAEDVNAYMNFIKEKVGLTHQDALVQAIAPLLEKVHPLALGKIEHSLARLRESVGKMLRARGKQLDQHHGEATFDEIAKALYFPDQAVNRKEAKDLGLEVKDAPPELESAMWGLYQDYEEQFNHTEVFNPLSRLQNLQGLKKWSQQLAQLVTSALQPVEELARSGHVPLPAQSPDVLQQALQVVQQSLQVVTQVGQLVQQLASLLQPSQAQYALEFLQAATGQLSHQMLTLTQQIDTIEQPTRRVQEAATFLQCLTHTVQMTQAVSPPEITENFLHAVIESEGFSSTLRSTARFRLYTSSVAESDDPILPGTMVRRDALSQQWTHLPAPARPQEGAAVPPD